ncbi:MAG: hypothetical protein ACOC0P_06650, partial [Planctomycetota bacterium]
ASSLADKRAAINGMQRERAGLEASIESIGQRRSTLIEQESKLKTRRRALDDRLTELEKERTDLATRRDDLSTKHDAQSDDLTRREAEAESLGGQQRDITRHLQELEREFARLDSRRHTLHEMQEAGEGLGEAVRLVLDQREDTGRFSFVRGLLAEEIETDLDHAPQIEAALGPMLQALLVDSVDDVISAGDCLGDLTGRVTFLSRNGEAAVSDWVISESNEEADDVSTSGMDDGEVEDDDSSSDETAPQPSSIAGNEDDQPALRHRSAPRRTFRGQRVSTARGLNRGPRSRSAGSVRVQRAGSAVPAAATLMIERPVTRTIDTLLDEGSRVRVSPRHRSLPQKHPISKAPAVPNSMPEENTSAAPVGEMSFVETALSSSSADDHVVQQPARPRRSLVRRRTGLRVFGAASILDRVRASRPGASLAQVKADATASTFDRLLDRDGRIRPVGSTGTDHLRRTFARGEAEAASHVASGADELNMSSSSQAADERISASPAADTTQSTQIPMFPCLFEQTAKALTNAGAVTAGAFVRTGEASGPVVDRLLSHTWIVDTLADAHDLRRDAIDSIERTVHDAQMHAQAAPQAFAALLAQARELLERLRFVTRVGCEVLEADGRLTAGPNAAEGTGAGLLVRRTELQELEHRLTELENEVNTTRERLASLDQQAADVDRVQAELRRELYRLRSERDKAGHAIERVQAELNRVTREVPSLDEELDSFTDRLQRLDAEREEKAQRITAIEQTEQELQAAVTELDGQLSEAREALNTVNEQLTSARVATGQASERLAAAERELRQIELNRTETIRQKEGTERAIAHRVERLSEYETTVSEAEAEIERCETFLNESATSVNELATRLNQLQTASSALGEQVHEARQEAGTIEQDHHRTEVAVRENEVKRENIEQRTLEDLQLDLPAIYPQYREERETNEDFEPIDRDEVRHRIEELRDEIKRLGNVNLDAIDEEVSLT